MLMKRYKYLLMLFCLMSYFINAQTFTKKWELILNLNDRDVYLDTTNIKHDGNLLSALIITVYKQPSFIPAINKDIIFFKTQALFNLFSKRAIIIGNLYYDKDLKIINDVSKSIQLSNANNEFLIDTSNVYSAVFRRCIQILKIDLEKIPKSETTERFSEFENYETGNNGKSNIIMKDLIDDNTSKFSKKEDNKQSLKKNIEQNYNEEYNFYSERNIYGMIFTDGNKYCFQVSAWKNKKKAEAEVKRLKDFGHNAFYIKAEIPNKGIWYRVRIGYFSSLKETEIYMKEMQ